MPCQSCALGVGKVEAHHLGGARGAPAQTTRTPRRRRRRGSACRPARRAAAACRRTAAQVEVPVGHHPAGQLERVVPRAPGAAPRGPALTSPGDDIGHGGWQVAVGDAGECPAGDDRRRWRYPQASAPRSVPDRAGRLGRRRGRATRSACASDRPIRTDSSEIDPKPHVPLGVRPMAAAAAPLVAAVADRRRAAAERRRRGAAPRPRHRDARKPFTPVAPRRSRGAATACCPRAAARCGDGAARHADALGSGGRARHRQGPTHTQFGSPQTVLGGPAVGLRGWASSPTCRQQPGRLDPRLGGDAQPRPLGDQGLAVQAPC